MKDYPALLQPLQIPAFLLVRWTSLLYTVQIWENLKTVLQKLDSFYEALRDIFITNIPWYTQWRTLWHPDIFCDIFWDILCDILCDIFWDIIWDYYTQLLIYWHPSHGTFLRKRQKHLILSESTSSQHTVSKDKAFLPPLVPQTERSVHYNCFQYPAVGAVWTLEQCSCLLYSPNQQRPANSHRKYPEGHS